MPKNTYDVDIEREAIQLVEDERNEWEDAVCFVTDKIAFNMRNLIKTLRKNYYGIFDEERDPITNAKKTWIPLTETVVESVVKNIDLDTKDINFRAKNAKARALTSFVREVVRNKLDQMYFGEKLDDMERNLAIDGTAIWKTYTTNDGTNKTIRLNRVDPLNFYIDPTSESIQSAGAVIERATLTPNDVKKMDGWKNTDDVQGKEGINRNMRDLVNQSGGDVEMVDCYERWGLMPRYLITGKKKDDDMVEGHIVVSGIETGDKRVHLIEENTTKDGTGKVIKPYEEVWYKKVPGRWWGRGVAEMLLPLQLWLNTVVNIRITRARVSQVGLFKVRKGSGVTSQMLSRLPVNGAVVVNNMEDIQQFVVQEASQASYADESNINDWAQKVTSAFETVTGESLPSSTPATNAVLQNRMAQSQFVMIKEQIGMFLQRWLKRHYIPMLGKILKKGDVFTLTGDIEEMRDMDNKIANKLIYDQMQEMMKNNQFVRPEQVMSEKQRILDKIKSQGDEKFIELMRKPEMTDYDVQVFITNEEIDKGVLVNNLISVLQTIPNIPGIKVDPSQVALSIFDAMGLNVKQFETNEPAMPTQQAPQPQVPQEVNPETVATPTEQRLTTEANTL